MADQPFSLNDLEETEQNTRKTDDTTSDSKKKLIIAGVALLFIILIIVMILMVVRKDDTKKEEEEHTDSRAIGEIDCVYDIEDYTKSIKILGDEFQKPTKLDILIDKNKIEFSKDFKFDKGGNHEIKFILYEDISMDFMFKEVKDLTSIIMITTHDAKIKSMESAFESCVKLLLQTVNYLLKELSKVLLFLIGFQVKSLDFLHFLLQPYYVTK